MIASDRLLPAANHEIKASRDSWFSMLVTAAALIPRLWAALVWAREPVWDGHYYHYGAMRIAEGLGYSEDVMIHGVPIWKPWTHYPVGYSAWLGGLYRIFGSHTWVAPVSNAVVGALFVLVIHRLAWRALGPWRGRLAALLVALHPGLILYSALVMTEAFAGFLVAMALLIFARHPDRFRSAAFAGVVLGFAVLVRPSSLLAVPLLAVVPGKFGRGACARALLALGLCIVTTVPWTLRNCERMDGCAFVSTNGGWNLAIGALTKNGRFQTLRASDGCPVVTGQVQQDRCWMQVGWRTILHAPIEWLSRAPAKLAQTFDHESFAVEYLHEADPKSWPEARRVATRELLTDVHRCLLAMALLSVVGRVGWKRWRSRAFLSQAGLLAAIAVLTYSVANSDRHPFYLLVLALIGLFLLVLPGSPSSHGILRFSVGFIAATAATHAIFFGDDRYHIVVSGFFCLQAAAALRPASRQPRPTIVTRIQSFATTTRTWVRETASGRAR